MDRPSCCQQFHAGQIHLSPQHKEGSHWQQKPPADEHICHRRAGGTPGPPPVPENPGKYPYSQGEAPVLETELQRQITDCDAHEPSSFSLPRNTMRMEMRFHNQEQCKSVGWGGTGVSHHRWDPLMSQGLLGCPKALGLVKPKEHPGLSKVF